MSTFDSLQQTLDDYGFTLAELRVYTQTQLDRGPQRSSVLTEDMLAYLRLREEAYRLDPTSVDPLPTPLVSGSPVDEVIYVHADELCDALTDMKARFAYVQEDDPV
jgi:hypothetical protein